MRKLGRILIAATALFGGTVGSVGCSSSVPVAPASVRGVVTFQNRPLTGGLIVFAPDREKGNSAKAVRATIDAEGRYSLSTDGSTHVAPGWYRIAIADPPGTFAEEFGFPPFPNALRRPDRSGLSREVRPGVENVLDFLIEVPVQAN